MAGDGTLMMEMILDYCGAIDDCVDVFDAMMFLLRCRRLMMVPRVTSTRTVHVIDLYFLFEFHRLIFDDQ